MRIQLNPMSGCGSAIKEAEVHSVEALRRDIGIESIEFGRVYTPDDVPPDRLAGYFGFRPEGYFELWFSPVPRPDNANTHVGRELSLMLSGEKPLAMFVEVLPHDEGLGLIPEDIFAPYVESGQFLRREIYIDLEHGYTRHVVCFAISEEYLRLECFLFVQERMGVNWSRQANDIAEFLLGYNRDRIDSDAAQ